MCTRLISLLLSESRWLLGIGMSERGGNRSGSRGGFPKTKDHRVSMCVFWQTDWRCGDCLLLVYVRRTNNFGSTLDYVCFRLRLSNIQISIKKKIVYVAHFSFSSVARMNNKRHKHLITRCHMGFFSSTMQSIIYIFDGLLLCIRDHTTSLFPPLASTQQSTAGIAICLLCPSHSLNTMSVTCILTLCKFRLYLWFGQTTKNESPDFSPGLTVPPSGQVNLNFSGLSPENH